MHNKVSFHQDSLVHEISKHQLMVVEITTRMKLENCLPESLFYYGLFDLECVLKNNQANSPN